MTTQQIGQFDKLLSLAESHNQMDRMIGRMRLREFVKKFSEKELDEAAKKIGARKTK